MEHAYRGLTQRPTCLTQRPTCTAAHCTAAHSTAAHYRLGQVTDR